MTQLIAEKRDGLAHSPDQIQEFIRRLSRKELPDYQVAAWLMAAYLNGLSPEETHALAVATSPSGRAPDVSGLPRPLIDKHSTGGVGDTVTLLFLPIVAAMGLTAIKTSGRGLGFTGGTVDKLSAIPGFRIQLSPEELGDIAREVGCAVAAQSADLAPADGILYHLRDATETVGSLPLIAASVMGKKLAGGADIILLDVKSGSGALMKAPKDAAALANAMLQIGHASQKKCAAVITDMSQPLGASVGNALEIRQAIQDLKSGMQSRLGRLTVELCRIAGRLAGCPVQPENVVQDGSALGKMKEWIAAQGGDARVVDDDALLGAAPVIHVVRARASGYLHEIECSHVGEVVRSLGGGRKRKEDAIDPLVGVRVHASIGDRIQSGDALFEIHANSDSDALRAEEELLTAVHIEDTGCEPPTLIHNVIGLEG